MTKTEVVYPFEKRTSADPPKKFGETVYGRSTQNNIIKLGM